MPSSGILHVCTYASTRRKIMMSNYFCFIEMTKNKIFAQWFVNFVSWFILSLDEHCLSISVCICTQMYRCLAGLFVCLSVRLSRPQSMLTNSSQTHLIHPKWESNYPVLRVFFFTILLLSTNSNIGDIPYSGLNPKPSKFFQLSVFSVWLINL